MKVFKKTLKFMKKSPSSILFLATVILLLTATLAVTVFGDANLTATVAVSGLTVGSSGATDWTASAGGVAWSGKTSSSTANCQTTYTPTSGTLTFTNNSGSEQVLSFDYALSLNDGSFTIDGESKTANGSFSKTLSNGASVTLVATSSSEAANTTTVTISNIKLEVQQITLIFAPPTNGS